jgi:hypothetical protein
MGSHRHCVRLAPCRNTACNASSCSCRGPQGRARNSYASMAHFAPPNPPPPNCSEHLSNGATAVHVVTLDWLHTHGTPAEDRAT